MVALSRDLIGGLLAVTEAATARHMWIDYDDSADVLYISFRKPQGANDTLMEDDGHLYHYHDSELVGITILNASNAKVGQGN
jgi:uncharacterized protein YuzE